MKNLPNKIYLNFGEITDEEFKEADFEECAEVTWCKDKVFVNDVEYTRTDAFIEKACEWLNNRMLLSSSAHVVLIDIVKDFRKAMEE